MASTGGDMSTATDLVVGLVSKHSAGRLVTGRYRYFPGGVARYAVNSGNVQPRHVSLRIWKMRSTREVRHAYTGEVSGRVVRHLIANRTVEMRSRRKAYGGFSRRISDGSSGRQRWVYHWRWELVYLFSVAGKSQCWPDGGGRRRSEDSSETVEDDSPNPLLALSYSQATLALKYELEIGLRIPRESPKSLERTAVLGKDDIRGSISPRPQVDGQTRLCQTGREQRYLENVAWAAEFESGLVRDTGSDHVMDSRAKMILLTCPAQIHVIIGTGLSQPLANNLRIKLLLPPCGKSRALRSLPTPLSHPAQYHHWGPINEARQAASGARTLSEPVRSDTAEPAA
ncbi:uncharacterized protein BO95DRAFT_437049 [Aspergillus brunneoviolaceus CBS 621.78]|uniref:Uncharacterized protein n=1 Tax=Aspergillus brunneoviolaceus CBS 621.78 TaxID=1450534 RepID=A0ACD1FSQ0_9EURO|nr:hypothetical protein BO95DRAFT_437049 [Aspergillus brunneoviolaceus CBS 621.78]RAH40017.1 hypothetical protein BO95DRAFT_437049 [Aspergillus brunneoviolaceus CBS 621.78]